MRITSVSSYPVILDCNPFTTSYGTIDRYRNVIVTIEDDNGHLGVGEASPGTPNENGETMETVHYAINTFIKPILLGTDPRNPSVIRERLNQTLAGHVVAKAAVDMALFDLFGKIAGLSVASLLGGKFRQNLPLIGAIGVKSAAEAATEAQCWKDRGALGIKMKAPSVLNSSISEIEAHIRAVRKQVGDTMMLIVDPNQGWINVGNTQKIVDKISDLDVYIEQPILAHDIGGLRTLSAMGARIIADEAVFTKQGLQAVIETRAVSIINVKLTRPGGFGEAMRFIHMAEGAGIKCQIDDVTATRITTTAVAHLAVAVHPATFFCYSVAPAHLWLHRDIVKEGGITIEDGLVSLSGGPGLGLNLDWDYLIESTNRAEREMKSI